jgi:hypothetical protein
MRDDRRWTKLILIYAGLFGAALAIAAMSIGLPAQATGTCGPGQGSEAAAIAFFDPVTIGAGAEPPASNQAEHTVWANFVHGCQSAADTRMLVALPLLVISLGLVVLGVVLLVRKDRRRDTPAAPSLGTGSGWGTPSPPEMAGVGSPSSGGGSPSLAGTHWSLSRPPVPGRPPSHTGGS